MKQAVSRKKPQNDTQLKGGEWLAPQLDVTAVLEHLDIGKLTLNPRNARKHTREQVRAIARSIEAFGFNAPILIDRTSQIVAGHGRVEAAKVLGYARVPVIRLDHLSEAQARAYMLADNKLTDRSSWDDGLLAVNLKELSELAVDFEIEATGFEPPEIDFLIQSLDDPEVSDKADTFQAVQGPTLSQPGDLWLLDGHRLICGSALDIDFYTALLGSDKAAAIFTDPPYNVRVDGHVCGNGTVKHREFAMASGEMSDDAFAIFLRDACNLIGKHAQSGAVIYTFMDWRHISEIIAAGTGAGFDLLNLCVWVKSNGGMGSLYRSQHELITVFRNGRGQHVNNVQLGRFGRNRTNVWNYPGANSFARKGRTSGLDHHPTTKPIALVADAIQDVTARGDIVLDPFSGSGTTILAAERTGRRGFGIELDPVYVDTAVARWEGLTGRTARHRSGATVSELRIARGVAP